MKLFLHAGFVKTGSTSIQVELINNASYLNNNKYYLPVSPSHLKKISQGLITSGNGQALCESLRSQSLDSVLSLLAQDVDAAEGCHNIIYSSENLFWHLSDEPTFTLLIQAVRRLGFSEIQCLLFTRNPESHALSWHGEMIKWGWRTDSISIFMNKYRFPCMVVKLLDLFAQCDLSSNVSIYNYSYRKKEIMQLTWDWLGIQSPNEPAHHEKNSINLNRSLTVSELELCRQLTLAGCNPRFLSAFLCNSLPSVQPSLPRPTPESVQTMYMKNRRCLQKINHFLDDNEQLPCLPAEPTIDCIPNNEYLFSAEQINAIAKILAKRLSVI